MDFGLPEKGYRQSFGCLGKSWISKWGKARCHLLSTEHLNKGCSICETSLFYLKLSVGMSVLHMHMYWIHKRLPKLTFHNFKVEQRNTFHCSGQNAFFAFVGNWDVTPFRATTSARNDALLVTNNQNFACYLIWRIGHPCNSTFLPPASDSNPGWWRPTFGTWKTNQKHTAQFLKQHLLKCKKLCPNYFMMYHF